jgi:UDP-N-acetylmuramyl pentapeptide phosphotransferase/UDP-N-acetylglucosamine-1-phosphate transferase
VCSVTGGILAIAVLTLMGVSSWITYPIAWNWWKPNADDVDRMRSRARQVGLRGWFTVGGIALVAALIFGLFHC